MPISLATAAQNWNTEEFLVWDPALNTFPRTVYGRKRRIDPFVSLWHRSSRRSAIFLTPGQDLTDVSVVRHSPSDVTYLISPTIEVDDYPGAGNYSRMVRCQKAAAPLGGQAELYPVRTSGTGDNLGAVSVGPAEVVYVDIELRTSEDPESALNEQVGDYLVFCSRNVSPLDGDYIKLNDIYYRAEEWYSESGFLCARATQGAPSFVTATFYLLDASAPVFDPATGEMTAGVSQGTRVVSVQIGRSEVVGKPSDAVPAQKLACYVDARHIGFAPVIGQRVVLDSVTYYVGMLERDSTNLQWKLELLR